MKYKLDDQIKAFRFLKCNIKSKPIIITNQFFTKLSQRLLKENDIVSIKEEKIRSSDGECIDIRIFKPKKSNGKMPALIYYHGGGFYFEASIKHLEMCRRLSEELKSVVINVSYRTMFDYVYPTQVEDSYSALLWVKNNARELNIDEKRIAVAGDSAGGNLAAATAIKARDEDGPELRCQLLINPALDYMSNTDSVTKFIDTPIWDGNANKLLWKRYLRNVSGDVSVYASPSLIKDGKNLPPCYLETAEFDPLLDEGRIYYEKLKADGCDIKYYQSLGTVHCFDLLKKCELSEKSISKRIKFLKEYL